MNNNAVALFESLHRDQGQLDRSAKQLEEQRLQAEARLTELRATKKKIEDDFRTVSAVVGQLHRKTAMYQQERQRLQAVLLEEREALEQCVAQHHDVMVAERHLKQTFCQNMAALNDELGELLMQQENMRLIQLISVHTMPLLRAVLQQQRQQQQLSSPCSMDGTPAADAARQAEHEESKENDDDEDEQKLLESTQAFEFWGARKKELQDTVAQLQQMALQSTTARGNQAPLTEAVLQEMERAWEEGRSYNNDNANGDENNAQQSDHMSLFYGSQLEVDDPSVTTITEGEK